MCSSKMAVDFQPTTWHYIPEDRTVYNHRCENLIFYKYCIIIYLFIQVLQMKGYITHFCYYEGESVNRSEMNRNCTTWYSNLEKNIYFSTYPPPTLIHLSYHFVSASKPTAYKLWLLSQPFPHLHFNLFMMGEMFAIKAVFSRPNRWKSLGANSRL
jgi:hypothetical protein